MRRTVAWVVWIGLCGGCSGGYALTAPDGLAPAGGDVPVVVHLQHRELPFFTPPVKGTALRFRLAEGPLRAAQTNKNGYATVSLAAPATTGVYPVNVALQDIEGEEASWDLDTFVWDAARPIVAVDLAAVLNRGRITPDAQAALDHLAGGANILYLTDESAAKIPKLHQTLTAGQLPDGPILLWGQQGWWQWPWWKAKAISSPLPRLREVFSGLEVGIAGSGLAVRAFHQAEMRCRLVRRLWPIDKSTPLTSWAELAEKGPQ